MTVSEVYNLSINLEPKEAIVLRTLLDRVSAASAQSGFQVEPVRFTDEEAELVEAIQYAVLLPHEATPPAPQITEV